MNPLKSFALKYKRNIIFTLSILLGIIGLTVLYYVIEVTPISNDECLWKHKKLADSVVVEFTNVKKNGVAWNAGIRDGDYLREINNVKISNNMVAMYILNQVDAGDYAKYVVERNGKVFNTKVFIKKLVSFGNLGFTLLGIFWLIVGFIVVMAKPDGKVQQLFYKIGVVLILYLTALLTPQGKLDFGGNFLWFLLNSIWTGFAIYLPFLIIQFFWTFPKPFKLMDKGYVHKIFKYVPLGIASVVIIIKFFLNYITFSRTLFINIQLIIFFFFISSLFIGLFSLLANYKRLNTLQERKPIRVIVLSYTLGVLSMIYFFVISTVKSDSIFNSPELFTPIILVVALPISFAYSIFRYQLLDVSLVIKNTIIYGTATIAIAAIYFLSVYGIGQWISTAIGTEYKSVIAAAAFVIFAIIFQSTKDKFQEILTKKFYPEQFTYQKVMLRFSKDVMSIVGLGNILNSMTETFVSSLRIKHFGILLRESRSNKQNGILDLTKSKPSKFFLKRQHNINGEEYSLLESQNFRDYIKQKLLLDEQISIDRQQFNELFPEDFNKLIDSGIFTIVPMIIKSNTIGLLLFGLKHAGSQFAGKDIELLCAAANQAAVSIENARLYESEAQRLTYERDLENARKIQEALLPKTIPQIPGLDIAGVMIPAMQVGGDYYDLIKISPEKLFIVVGDVSGKGLSASLYMSKLQTMMRLYCTADKSPKEILIEVNKKIYESIERNWFITVNLALVDTVKKTIKFCRAGHCPVLEVNNGFLNSYQSKGIGLGLEEGRIFADTLEETVIDYQSGNFYAFISDGVSEAMNEKDQLYGLEEFEEVIKNQNGCSTKETMEKILISIKAFKGEREQNDDITIVLLKIL